MKKILFLFLLFSISQTYGEVFISSVFPNTNDDTTLEYVELYNSSGSSRSLSGYTLSDVSGKTYLFGSGSFLASRVFTPFYRPQTKILLNNTSETVFLKNPAGLLIDSISYTTSSKGQKITFLEKIPSQIISDESYLWNPKLYYSTEAPGVDIVPQIPRLIPEILFLFQQPSYVLDAFRNTSLYYCDTTQSDCRVNFDLRPSFIQGFRESDFECLIDFGFTSTESSKCNPSTVILKQGENSIRFQISLKSDKSVVLDRTIKILYQKNSVISVNPAQHTPSGPVSLKTNSPDIVLTFQQPNYTYFDNEGNLVCDRTKKLCRSNFDLTASFSSLFPESGFVCEIYIGTQKISSCNPGTFDISSGEQEVTFKIISKKDASIFSEKKLLLKNKGFFVSELKPLSISSTFRLSDFITIKKPYIKIQSGLIGDISKLWCKGKKCQVNLEYIKRNTKERCLWNFGEGEYKISSLTRCNPGLVEFPPGIHRLTLKVYQSNNKTNYRESRLAFSYFPDEIGENLEIKQKEILSDETSSGSLQIVLQGKIGKNKILEGKKLICTTKDTCSVNFISDSRFLSQPPQDIVYFWDFGNGDTFEGKNPKSISYPPGIYQIQLTTTSEGELLIQDIFVVEIVKLEKKTQHTKGVLLPGEKQSFSGSLSIISLIPNPVGSDVREWIEIQNIGENQVSLDTCLFKNGKKKSKFPIGYSIFPGESQKIFRVFSSFSLGNKAGKVELICGSVLQDSFTWIGDKKEGVIFFKNKKIISSYSFSQEDFNSIEEYKQFVEKTWKLNPRKLKNSIKISGETLALQSLEIVSSQGKKYKLISDKNGLFEISIDRNISVGGISFLAYFTDEYTNIFSFDSDKKFIITKVDINNFLKKYQKKLRKKRASKSLKVSRAPEVFIFSSQKSLGDTTIKTLLPFAALLWIFFFSSITLFGLYFLLPKKSGEVIYTLIMFQTRQKILLII